jgi:hypothetical protein
VSGSEGQRQQDLMADQAGHRVSSFVLKATDLDRHKFPVNSHDQLCHSTRKWGCALHSNLLGVSKSGFRRTLDYFDESRWDIF